MAGKTVVLLEEAVEAALTERDLGAKMVKGGEHEMVFWKSEKQMKASASLPDSAMPMMIWNGTLIVCRVSARVESVLENSERSIEAESLPWSAREAAE